MAYARRREHWVFMDSRGTGIYEKISGIDKQEYVGIWKESGATLERLVELAGNHLKSYPYDPVYIVGGVNNITTKNKITGEISFKWDPPELLIQYMLNLLSTLDKHVSKEFPASKIIFCPLVGSELRRVVTEHWVAPNQQDAVNEAVFTFNEETFKINKRKQTFSPSLHRSVHRSKNGKRKSYYDHLEDGLHLTEELKDKWAHKIVKSAALN